MPLSTRHNTLQCCHTERAKSPSQVAFVVIITTRKTLAERDVLIADRAGARLFELLLRRPDLPTLALFARTMLHDYLTAAFLEEQRAFLHTWVQFAVDEDPGVDVGLRALTEDLVFLHDASVQV